MDDKISREDYYKVLQSAYALSLDYDRITQSHQHLHEENQCLLDRLKNLRENLEGKITDLQKENAYLKEQLKLRDQRHFGKKTESTPLETGEVSVSLIETVASYMRRKKKSAGRLVDMSNLPEKIIEHDFPASERYCSHCHEALEFFEKEMSEGQIEIVPVKYYKVVHVRSKYRCRQCDQLVMAPKEPSPIPKALAGSSLLTEVILGKYLYHLPLYRQSQLMRLEKIMIPDNTLSNWVMTLGDALLPLYEALFEEVLKSLYLQVDETPVKLLKPNKKGYVWTYVAPQKKLVAFECSDTRSKKVVDNRLNDFQGLLQTDGYGAYQGLREKEAIRPLGCLSHARRKFVEVIKISKNPHGIAGQVIERLKPLYALEQFFRDNRCDARTRKRLRQKKAYPLLKSLKSFLKKHQPSVAPQSALGNALRYFLNQWAYFTTYLRHGVAEIDNNIVENKIRPLALGRKNWLFMRNQETGTLHAVFYSLLISAIFNNINPRIYLHYLLTQVHSLRKKTVDPSRLLPHRIDQTLLEDFAQKWFNQARDIFDSS